jgi:hypothetical protein
MVETIKITISPDGMKVDAAGFTGGKCLVEQGELEKFLTQQAGITVSKKNQKRKLEQQYQTAPGQQVKR